jgi:crotonobetainyl-CoA:carnitine CoA-transferase CaiB-like acyl-CoA transferase
MGAEIIKVEDPDVGDYMRNMHIEDLDSLYEAVNRGKKSVTVDLKAEEGKDVFFELVADADAIIEQFRPGVVEQLDIGFETVRSYNPDLVYCSLTGYGQEGPYRDRIGHDVTYAGISGLLDMSRYAEDEKPPMVSYPIGDMAGGVFSAFSIVTGLLSRELGNSEGGEYIDVSMLDALISFSPPILQQASLNDEVRPGGVMNSGAYACYNVYETADERYVTLAAIEPKFWKTFCEAIDRPDLVEDHMAETAAERERVRTELADLFRTKSQAEWERILGDSDTMFGTVKTPSEVLEDPHVRSRGVLDTDDDGILQVSFPGLFSTELQKDASAPKHGEDTNAVLSDHGFDRARIQELSDHGII